MASVPLVLLAVLFFGDELVLVLRDLPLARVGDRRAVALLGVQRERRQQLLDRPAPARRARRRRILRPHERLEFVIARGAAVIVERHTRISPRGGRAVTRKTTEPRRHEETRRSPKKLSVQKDLRVFVILRAFAAPSLGQRRLD